MHYGLKKGVPIDTSVLKPNCFRLSDKYSDCVCFEELVKNVSEQKEVGERLYFLYTPNFHTGEIKSQKMDTRLTHCDSEKLAHAISMEYYRRMWLDLREQLTQLVRHPKRNKGENAEESALISRLNSICLELQKSENVKAASSRLVHVMLSLYTNDYRFLVDEYIRMVFDELKIQESHASRSSKICKERLTQSISLACRALFQPCLDEGVLKYVYNCNAWLINETESVYNCMARSSRKISLERFAYQFYMICIQQLQKKWQDWWDQLASDDTSPKKRIQAGMGESVGIKINADNFCPLCGVKGEYTRFNVPVYIKRDSDIEFLSYMIVSGYRCMMCGTLFVQKDEIDKVIKRVLLKRSSDNGIFGYSKKTSTSVVLRNNEYLTAPVAQEKLFIDISTTSELTQGKNMVQRLMDSSFLREMGYNVALRDEEREQILRDASGKYGKRAVIDHLRFLINTREKMIKDYSRAIVVWKRDIEYTLHMP